MIDPECPNWKPLIGNTDWGTLPQLNELCFNSCGVFLVSASSSSMAVHESPRWRSQADAETQSLQLDSEGHTKAAPTLTSTPLKQGYVRFNNITPYHSICYASYRLCVQPVLIRLFWCVCSCVSCLSAVAASRTLKESRWCWMTRSSRRSSVWQDSPPQTNSQVRVSHT